jgi:hypothetical protein
VSLLNAENAEEKERARRKEKSPLRVLGPIWPVLRDLRVKGPV